MPTQIILKIVNVIKAKSYLNRNAQNVMRIIFSQKMINVNPKML